MYIGFKNKDVIAVLGKTNFNGVAGAECRL